MTPMRSERTERSVRRLPWKLSLVGFLFLVLLAAAIQPVRILRDARTHCNQFAVHAGVQDGKSMREDLDHIAQDRERLRAWKLGWFADRYVFSDNIYREAKLLDLTGEYAAVLARMEGIEDRRAYFFRMLSHFHLQRELYNAGKRSIAIDAVLKETSGMARQALQAAAPHPNPIDVYNYDLLTNPEMVHKALGRTGPPIKYRLGPEPAKVPKKDENGLKQPGNFGGNGTPKRKG